MQSSAAPAAWLFLPVTEQHLDRVLQQMKCLKKVVVSCNTGQSVSEMTFLVPFKDSDSKAGQAFYLCDSPGILLLLHHYKVIKIEPKLKRTEPKFRRRNILYSPIGPR